jgi:hypothetical protein
MSSPDPVTRRVYNDEVKNLPILAYPLKRVSKNFEIWIPAGVAKMDRSKLAV